MNIQEYKERSELSREQGHLPEALVSIDQAIALAGAQAEYKELLECMAYRLEVWKFFYKKTKQEVFWELLKGDCMSGLQIADAYKVYGHPRAVMLLRRGTYEMFKESFSEAVVWFEKAYAELSGEAEVGTRAEFLGHLGEAEGLSGKRVGVTHLEQAVEQAKSLATQGDVVILSPGFASFGMFQNEYDRGDKFIATINKHF
jgi:tetratricopeptide (TPR) repeat protein